MPGLAEMLLNATMLPSTNRQMEMRARADLCFRPPLDGIGMLDWPKFDAVVRIGRESATAQLANFAGLDKTPPPSPP
jgi:NTE family protein